MTQDRNVIVQSRYIATVTVILAADAAIGAYCVCRTLVDGWGPWVVMAAVCLLVVISGHRDLRAMRAGLARTRQLLRDAAASSQAPARTRTSR